MAGRGEIIKRTTKAGEARYVARVWADRRRSQAKTFTRRRDAEAWLTARNAEVQRRGLIVASRQPLGAYLLEWLETWCHELRPHIRDHYRASLLRYVVDPGGLLDAKGQALPLEQRPRDGRAVPPAVKQLQLGARPLATLRAEDFQRLFNAIRGEDGGHRAAQYLYAILKMAMKRAVIDDKLYDSPLDRVPRPKAPERRERRILSPAQVRAFIDAIATHPHRALWTLLVMHGVRPGEALALRWSEVDLESRSLQVTATLTPGRARHDPKTKAGARTVPLSTTAVEALRAHRAGDKIRALHGDSLVFVTAAGTPEHARNVTRRFRALVAKLAKADSTFPADITLYELRHTAASLLLSKGKPLPAVSKMIGHASPKTTLQFYAKALPSDVRDLADTMDELVSPPALQVIKGTG